MSDFELDPSEVSRQFDLIADSADIDVAEAMLLTDTVLTNVKRMNLPDFHFTNNNLDMWASIELLRQTDGQDYDYQIARGALRSICFYTHSRVSNNQATVSQAGGLVLPLTETEHVGNILLVSHAGVAELALSSMEGYASMDGRYRASMNKLWTDVGEMVIEEFLLDSPAVFLAKELPDELDQ